VTISNPDKLSSSETGVNISWNKRLKKHLSDCARCQRATGGIYFKKKNEELRFCNMDQNLKFSNPGFKAVSSNASPG
jgi:hypothetical protein